MRKILALSLALALGMAASGPALALQSQPKSDNGRILGTWSLDLFAGGMTISMTLVLQLAEGKLAGKLSESTGMIPETALEKIEYTGEDLRFETTFPSPPDGSTRTWLTELKIGDDTAEGSISNVELAMSATISGKRIQK